MPGLPTARAISRIALQISRGAARKSGKLCFLLPNPFFTDYKPLMTLGCQHPQAKLRNETVANIVKHRFSPGLLLST
jgi:hypothetical protein